MIKLSDIVIYTDGACSGNPGPGGWGFVITIGEHILEFSGGAKLTTNNRMELMSAIKALHAISKESKIKLVSDSKYLVEGMTKWLDGWKEKGWKTAGKDPVKNIELWQELDKLNQKHDIKWEWVKGHDGHEFNERCDELARLFISYIQKQQQQ